MPQLDFSTFSSQLFWLALSFGVLYYFMAAICLPQIRDVIREREERITGDIARARQLKEQAENAKSDYTLSLEDSRSKAATLIATADAKIRAETAERSAELEIAIERKLAQADKALLEVRERTLQEYQPIVVELAQDIVKKLTGIAVDTNVVKAAVDQHNRQGEAA